MGEEIKIKHIRVDDSEKDDMISKLIYEKKDIKQKNMRLTALLNLVAKDISNTTDDVSHMDGSKSSEIVDKMILLKKQVSLIEHMLEKSKIDSKMDELNKTVSDISSRVDDIESRLSAVHKIGDIESKLNDIESLMRLHKKSKDNPFGMIGVIGGNSADNKPDASE